jgi:hypothetical protein
MKREDKFKMTDTLPDFKRYQYGALGAYLLQSKDKDTVNLAPGALEVLVGSKGLNLGEDSMGLLAGTQASEKGLKTAFAEYNRKFEEKRGEYKPAELVSWYDPALKGLEDAEKNKLVGALGKHDETIKSIREKYHDAVFTTSDEAPKGKFTDQQITKAKETIEKYNTVLSIMQTLDRYMLESLRPDAVNSTRIATLKDLASKL